VTDLVPCEDAHAQERALTDTVFSKAQPGELWLGDRNMCTRGAMITVHERESFFLFREHGAINLPTSGKRRKIGRTETGTVYEESTEIPMEDGKCLQVRRIEIVLDTPTIDGDTVIRLLTNLPAAVRAKRIADLYRRRWSIEGMFGRLEAALKGEVRTLGYPRAALLAFGCAVIAYNVLSLIQTAIAAVHDLDSEGIELSTYYIVDDIRPIYRGMMRIVPDDAWATLPTEDPIRLAQTLRQIAKHVVPRTLRKHPRAPKHKKPKGYAMRGAVQKHVATARALRDGGIR